MEIYGWKGLVGDCIVSLDGSVSIMLLKFT